MLQGEHYAILSTFIKQPFVTKILVLSILSGRFTQALLYAETFKAYNLVSKIDSLNLSMIEIDIINFDIILNQ